MNYEEFDKDQSDQRSIPKKYADDADPSMIYADIEEAWPGP